MSRLPQRRISLAAMLAATLAGAVVAAEPAGSSTLIDRNARAVELTVDGRGRAVVSYRDQRGRSRHVLAWGALNRDVQFKLDYSGGWGTFRSHVWKSIRGCRRYDGPRLGWFVAGCKAPDGSYWALQQWQRLLPNQGYAPSNPLQASWELRLSHWQGPLPTLEIYLDWVFGGRFHHLFGRYLYQGEPVYGFESTQAGAPLDPYGRNIYLDVYNAAYGRGWNRENSFLSHRPNGNFCYGFYPRKRPYDGKEMPAGNGERYRATAIGPGVAPDVVWTGWGLGTFDPEHERRMNALADSMSEGDPFCQRR
jgi:hypothetical protein